MKRRFLFAGVAALPAVTVAPSVKAAAKIVVDQDYRQVPGLTSTVEVTHRDGITHLQFTYALDRQQLDFDAMVGALDGRLAGRLARGDGPLSAVLTQRYGPGAGRR